MSNEVARPIEAITSEILFYKAQVGTGILEIGKRLIEVKEQLPHGEWLPYLREKVDFSERSANNFMKLAREWKNPHSIADLGVTKAIALLSIPESDREDFAQQTDAEHITVKELQAAIKARQEAENREKGWRLKAEKAAADRDLAKEAAAQREGELVVAQNRIDSLTAEVKELRDAPRETKVEVQTINASEEQIKRAMEKGRAEATEKLEAAQQEIAALRASKSEADPNVKLLAEVNAHFKTVQTCVEQITTLLDKMDDVTAQRVRTAMRGVLGKI